MKHHTVRMLMSNLSAGLNIAGDQKVTDLEKQMMSFSAVKIIGQLSLEKYLPNPLKVVIFKTYTEIFSIRLMRMTCRFGTEDK